VKRTKAYISKQLLIASFFGMKFFQKVTKKYKGKNKRNISKIRVKAFLLNRKTDKLSGNES